MTKSPTGRAPSQPNMQSLKPPLTVEQRAQVEAVRLAVRREHLFWSAMYGAWR